jgi:hypothetical protein
MTSRGPTLAFFFAFIFFSGALVYWVLQQPGVRRASQGENAPNSFAPGTPEPRRGAPASGTARLGKQTGAGSETGPPVLREASAIRGEPIRPLTQTNGSMPQTISRPSDASSLSTTGRVSRSEGTSDAATRTARAVPTDGATLDWEVLSGFKFDVYEIASENAPGRPLLTSDDPIPDDVKAWNGRRVTVEGFVLPLRTRQRQVTEFLLLRDQGSCCFGPKAQINHFIRVKYFQGFRPNAPVPYRATGVLRVGEIRVQGYLTGIYEMDASHVEAGEED